MKYYYYSSKVVLLMALLLTVVGGVADDDTNNNNNDAIPKEGEEQDPKMSSKEEPQCESTTTTTTTSTTTGSQRKRKVPLVEQEEENSNDNDNSSIWVTGTVDDIREYLQCESLEQRRETTYYDDAIWKLFHDTYQQVVPSELSSLPERFETSGFEVDFDVQMIDEYIGRAILAKQDIPQGQLIWKSTNTAAFYNPHHYRKYLQALPADLACDVMMWAYMRYDEHDRPVVCCDLDHGSFANSAEDDSSDLYNMGIREDLLYTGCHLEFYATRDITAGEEIRVAYGIFVEYIWESMGLES